MKTIPDKHGHWILDKDGRTPIQTDLHTWGQWFGNGTNRILARDHRGDVEISTVFLGINHGFDGSPLLWETMIFGGEHDQYCNRYATYEEAKAGHEIAKQMVCRSSLGHLGDPCVFCTGDE